MMQTPGPGDRQMVLGDYAGMALGPDPAGASGAGQANGGRMPLALPPQPQSWGLQNPTLPSQLQGWLRNYYGGVGSLDETMLDGLVQAARQGTTWDAAHGDIGHGNDGLPDGGANLPADGTMGGVGTGPKRYGGSNDLSEPQPTWLGTVNPNTWGQSIGGMNAPG